MKSNVEQYCEMIVEYHQIIDTVGWYTNGERESLVRKMDPVWNRMSDEEKKRAIKFQEELYSKRIKG